MTTVVGIIGGVGSGKSTVSGILREMGARVIDADELAHRVLDEPAVASAIRGRFGAGVADERGRIVREKLAAEVFGRGRESARRDLEAIVHPMVRERIRAALDLHRAGGAPLVVLDVPLLIGSPFEDECDRILFVRAGAETRRRRTEARGWAAGEIDAREAAQPALGPAEAAADMVVENDGDLRELRQRLAEIVASLRHDRAE